MFWKGPQSIIAGITDKSWLSTFITIAEHSQRSALKILLRAPCDDQRMRIGRRGWQVGRITPSIVPKRVAVFYNRHGYIVIGNERYKGRMLSMIRTTM